MTGSVPFVVASDGTAIATDTSIASRDSMPELLRRHLEVVGITQVAGVAILVAATQR